MDPNGPFEQNDNNYFGPLHLSLLSWGLATTGGKIKEEAKASMHVRSEPWLLLLVLFQRIRVK
jgi:hypothetical protein